MDKEETVRDILKEDVEWLEDMPTGSDLDKYRESASFSWKRLRIVLEDPDVLKLKVNLLRYTVSAALYFFFYCHIRCGYGVLWKMIQTIIPSATEQRQMNERELRLNNHQNLTIVHL